MCWVKAARLQIAFPAQINLGGLAAQGLGPVWQRRVDSSAAVGAKISWETQQHQFFLAMCGRLAGIVQDRAPAFVGDVMVDEIFDAMLALLCRRPALLLVMLDIVMRESAVSARKSVTVRPASAAVGSVSRGAPGATAAFL
jgi:hypothetical protein